MKNSQQHLGNEANVSLRKNINVVPRLLSHFHTMSLFLMVSPLLGRFFVCFNLQSEFCGLQSVVCGLQSGNVIHRLAKALKLNVFRGLLFIVLFAKKLYKSNKI